MKKFTVLFAIFFLFSFVSISFAAEIKLQDTSSPTEKSIAVSINTKEEVTENVKIVIENSPNVTITDIIESDIACSTFSYVPTSKNSEIICSLPSSQPIQGLIAKILFTSTSDDYTFTIVEEDSQVGNLTIENVTNVGLNTQTTTTDMGEDSSTPSATTQTTTPTAGTLATNTNDSLMIYLPYILLGVAGIFFVSMIILILTRKKDDVVLTDLPASTAVASPSTEPQPVTQPQQPVNFDNIPKDLQNETMHDNISQPKPTLAEMINQPAPTAEPTPEQPTEQIPAIPETPPVASTTPNEQADLEALLRSENPSIAINTPTEAPNTMPSQSVQPTPQEPIQEAVATPSTTNGLLNNYSANVSEGGLPRIGSVEEQEETPLNADTEQQPPVIEVSPTDTNTDMGHQPSVMPQVEVLPTDTNTGIDNDLQNLQNVVREEINGIAKIGEAPIDENIPTNQM